MKIKEFLFTGFYSGYCPIAPGTAGTLVAMAIYILEYLIFGSISWIVNLAVVVVLFYPAIKLGDAGEEFFGKKDAPEIVLDEMMGYWISVMFFSFNITIVILAFFLFRFFDILKPFPANRLQNLRGGAGVMLDDYVAGLYTFIILNIFVVISRSYNLPFGF